MLFFLASTLLAGAEGLTPPYSSTMYGENSGWTTVNVDETTKTWIDNNDEYDYEDTPFTEGKEFKDRNKKANDWLISPAIRLEAGKEYKVSFWLDVYSGWDDISFSWADSDSVESLSAESALLFTYVYDTYDWNKTSVVVTPTETKDYYFGFHVYSESNSGSIYLTGFNISENVFIPGAPTGLAVAPDLNGAVEATVSWSLPKTDADGVALPADAVFNKVEVYRDDDLIKELPGNAVSFVDNEANGLTSGKHKYGVAVTVNGVKGKTAEITSRHIGPLDAKDIPWTAGINNMTNEEFQTYYTILKGASSTVKSDYGWAFKYKAIQFNPRSSGACEDDWLVLPRLKFEKAGIYRVRINAEYDEIKNADLGVYIGSERSIDSFTKKLGEFVTLPENASDTYVTFEIDNPGEYYIAFHAGRAESGSSRTMYINEINVEATEELPCRVSDLKAVVADGSVTLSWKAPALMNTGKEITAIDKITVYRNDDILVEITKDIVPGGNMSYVDTPETSGVFTYYVVPEVGGKTPDDAPEKITTPWVGDILQTLPYDLDFTKNVDVNMQKSFWKTYNNDDDEYVWSVKSSGFTLELDSWGGSTDDTLVSPPFEITPGNYVATLNIKGGESNFPLQIGFVKENDETHTIIEPQTIKLKGYNSYAEYPVHISSQLNGRHCLAIQSKADYDDPYNVVVNRVRLEHDNTTSVIGIEDDMIDYSDVEYYDVNGLKVAEPQRGSIYIIRTGNGKTYKKVFGYK